MAYNGLACPDKVQKQGISLARDFPSEIKHQKSGGQSFLALFFYISHLHVYGEEFHVSINGRILEDNLEEFHFRFYD